MENVIRVEKNELNTLISNLQTYYENISTYIEDAEEIVAKLLTFFEGEIPDSITSKFGEFQLQFPNLKKTLESFIEDFKKLDVAFEDEQSEISTDEVELDKGGEFINVNN